MKPKPINGAAAPSRRELEHALRHKSQELRQWLVLAGLLLQTFPEQRISIRRSVVEKYIPSEHEIKVDVSPITGDVEVSLWRAEDAPPPAVRIHLPGD